MGVETIQVHIFYLYNKLTYLMIKALGIFILSIETINKHINNKKRNFTF